MLVIKVSRIKRSLVFKVYSLLHHVNLYILISIIENSAVKTEKFKLNYLSSEVFSK